jgi:uncharacterized membrane protein YvbJ
MCGVSMGFCHKCGTKLAEDAFFCPNCGARTTKGEEAGVSSTADDMKDAFSKMGQEMEKAFTVAAKEMQKAFRTAGENIRKSTVKETIVCSDCGEKSEAGSTYCHSCGKRLQE